MTASGGSIESAFQFSAVTPSDSAKLTYVTSAGITEVRRCKAIFVGGAGAVAIKDDAGNACTFTGCTAGSVYPVSTDQILSTGTTASSLIALF